MTSKTDSERLDALEKRVAELAALVHFQDLNRVKIEKSLGVIDQQLIRTDAGLHQMRQAHQGAARKPMAKAKVKAKPKPRPTKTKTKPRSTKRR